jgi:hypothetical protein
MAEQQPQPPAAQPQPPAAQPQPPTLLGVAERLLAGAAVASGGIYVLINALYIEFYDDFGVRPEDVGWDRLAILGRAAWVAFSGIIVIGLIGWTYATITARNRLRALRQDIDRRHEAKRISEEQKKTEKLMLEHPLGYLLRLNEPERQQLIARIAEERMWKEEFRRQRARRLLGAASLAFPVLILVGFLFLDRQVEGEAARVTQGVNVNGISFGVPFAPYIDVHAIRAKATWLGDKEKQPVELGSPYLMYLGRSRDVVVLLACGHTTVLVPADNVAIDLLSDMTEDQQREQFSNLCGG